MSFQSDDEQITHQVYRCYFDDDRGFRHSTDTTQGVWFCKEGFWVDEKFQYTTELDAMVHWIPPHRIVLLTKLLGVRR